MNDKLSNEQSSSKTSQSHKVIAGTAIAGGVAGLAIAGPLVGLATAAGGAVLATRQNKAGDLARASGNVVVAAGERAKKIDEKHHLLEKTKKATAGLVQKGNEINDKHHVTDKTKRAAANIVNKSKEFEQKHHLGEKAGSTITKGLTLMSQALQPKDKS